MTRREVGHSARTAVEARPVFATPPISMMPVEYLTPTIEDRALEVQLLLANKGPHRTASIPDLIIAATAENPQDGRHCAARAWADGTTGTRVTRLRNEARTQSGSPRWRGRGYGREVTSSPRMSLIPARLRDRSWWFRSSDGRMVLWQLPNPALCVWMAALVLGWFELSATHATAVDGVRHGALLVWALDEVVRGASPFRRLLGAVVLAAQLASLVRG